VASHRKSSQESILVQEQILHKIGSIPNVSARKAAKARWEKKRREEESL
jgi:hypothetical protein